MLTISLRDAKAGFSSLGTRSIRRTVGVFTGLDRLDEPGGHVGCPVSRAAPGKSFKPSFYRKSIHEATFP